MSLGGFVDKLIEAPVVPSFTRFGYEARSRLAGWGSLDRYDATGAVMVVTGATSGLGRATATQLARCGATVVVVGRNEDRNQAAVQDISDQAESDRVTQIPADMSHFDQVRELAARILADHDRLDVLIHNAGALNNQRVLAPDGTEETVATHVVGPFLLTSLLVDRLTKSAPSRVLTMSSGGMYSTGLTVRGLQMTPDTYRGTEQYARAKRAQVTLNELWAERFGDRGIQFHAMHPGWADTPGVDDALPGFARMAGPLFRTPEQGADTMVWLACDGTPLQGANGRFWLDRRARSTHKLPMTKERETETRRQELWEWVATTAGVNPT